MILVSGGTGFAGRHIVPSLAAQGKAVRVLSRRPKPALFGDGVVWVVGDLLDDHALDRALDGVETVVHAAGVVDGTAGPQGGLTRVNVLGAASLARAVRSSKVRRFLHISSAGVYGNGSQAAPHAEDDLARPVTPYERSKLDGERVVRETLGGSGIEWTILRPQGLFGPDRPDTVRLFRRVATVPVWLHGPARVLVHPTNVRDLVSAVSLVLMHGSSGGEVINIGGARALEFRDLIALIGERIGHTPAQVSAPSWLTTFAAAGARSCARLGLSAGRLERLAMPLVNRAVNIDKARRLLGFKPVPLEQGLDETARALCMRSAA